MRLPTHLEAQRLELLGLAQRRSFESYMRRGRVPEGYQRAATFAMNAAKSVDPSVTLPPAVTSRSDRDPATTYYVWRTAADDRVRSSHAALTGQIFSRDSPPPNGHPGSEPNCRCWAEPYFGDPAIPDALLQLQRTIEDDTTGQAIWSRIETLRRPDGSLAQSSILGRDVTRFLSLFSGTHVSHLVALADGHRVRLDTSNGVQTIYVDDAPWIQTAWTSGGLRISRTRRDVAFLGDDPNQLFEGPGDGLDLESDVILDPNPVGGLPVPDPGAGLGIAALALLALYAMQQKAPASMGVAEDEHPVAVFKSWQVDGAIDATPVMVDALTEEQVRQACKRLPEVQAWTDQAAGALIDQRASMTARDWGTIVHTRIRDTINALKSSLPMAYLDLRAELSVHKEIDNPPYGARGSIRVDIFEDRTEDMGAICFYDVKTGQEGLTQARVRQIAEIVVARYGAKLFYIIEVRPKL